MCRDAGESLPRITQAWSSSAESSSWPADTQFTAWFTLSSVRCWGFGYLCPFGLPDSVLDLQLIICYLLCVLHWDKIRVDISILIDKSILIYLQKSGVSKLYTPFFSFMAVPHGILVPLTRDQTHVSCIGSVVS